MAGKRDDPIIQALLQERAGYEAAGLTAQVAAVDEGLKALGYSAETAKPAPRKAARKAPPPPPAERDRAPARAAAKTTTRAKTAAKITEATKATKPSARTVKATPKTPTKATPKQLPKAVGGTKAAARKTTRGK